MASHLALPREGHLEQVLHIFSYLKCHHNAEMVFDPSDPVIDDSLFERHDWTSSEFGHLEGRKYCHQRCQNQEVIASYYMPKWMQIMHQIP